MIVFVMRVYLHSVWNTRLVATSLRKGVNSSPRNRHEALVNHHLLKIGEKDATIVDKNTQVFAIFGFPLEHSLSPIIFNGIFKATRFNGVFLPFAVRPNLLKEAVDAAKVLGIRGFSVTMPHKIRIVPLLDSVDLVARRIGSVNGAKSDRNGFVGFNSDGEGAIRAIKAYGVNPRGMKVLLIGAGGASRALLFYLAQHASEIRILNRTVAHARNVAEIARGKAGVSFGRLNRRNLEQALSNSELVVNATPVQTKRLLLSLGLPKGDVGNKIWLFDLSYNRNVQFVPARARTISALELLVQQAALSYERWFGRAAPVNVMREILMQYLESNKRLAQAQV